MPVVCKAWGKGVELVKLRHFSEVDDGVTALSYIKHVDCSSVESIELFIDPQEMETEVCIPGLAAAIEMKFSALHSLDLRISGGAKDMDWLLLLPVTLRHLCIDLGADSAHLRCVNKLVNLERFEMDVILDHGSCIILGDLTLPQLSKVEIRNVWNNDGLVEFVDLTLKHVSRSCVLMTNVSRLLLPRITQATVNFVSFD